MIKLYTIDEFNKNGMYYDTVDEKCSICVINDRNEHQIFLPYIYDDNRDEYQWVADSKCSSLEEAVTIINKYLDVYSHLVLNQIKTPDGTVLTSRHRHDYQQYTDVNGEEYMVDGGLDYIRRITGQKEPYEEQSVYSHESFEIVREALTWGSYGKNCNEPFHFIQLSNMTNGHIQAILDNNMSLPYIRRLMRMELEYRKIGNIIKFDKPKKFQQYNND